MVHQVGCLHLHLGCLSVHLVQLGTVVSPQVCLHLCLLAVQLGPDSCYLGLNWSWLSLGTSLHLCGLQGSVAVQLGSVVLCMGLRMLMIV